MIAIPNMDRPESCWECRLMDGEANCLVTDEGIPSKQEGILPDCPLIDIDIVRCRDCKWFAEEGYYCANNILVQFEHFFCYYGERRSDESDRKTLL